MGSLSLLQGIFPTQESNPGLPHCRQILYQLSPIKKQKCYLEMKASSSASSRRARSQTGRVCFPLWSGSASAGTYPVTRTLGRCIHPLPECTSCCSFLSLLLTEPRPGEHRQESSHPKAPCPPPTPPSPRPQRARCGYFQCDGRSSGSQFTDISKDAAFPRLQLDSASLAQWFCQSRSRFALPPALPDTPAFPPAFTWLCQTFSSPLTQWEVLGF